MAAYTKILTRSKGILSFSYAYGTNTPGLCDYVRLPKVTSSVFHFLDSLGGRFFRSAGNGYYEYEQSYAREPSVLVVAAFDYSADSADPTNFRRVSMYHETVDFCLPGEWPATATGGGYTPRFSYTSASTPAMAGIFGLMRYYDMCNDSISWTSDEIVARLKASCTSLESVWGDDPIRPAVGKLGAGYPNVYHAMTMDSLVFVDVSAEPLMFPDSIRSLSSLVSPGDTLMIRYAVTASGSVSDTIWIEPYSQDASITVVGGTTMIDSVALDSTYFDSLTFAIPSSTEPGTCVRVCLVVTDSADYADTVSLEALVLTPRAQWSLSRANSMSCWKVLTYAINYGNTDDDGNPEAVFYLVDSLYCVDLENGEVESGFPIPVSIPYDPPIQSVLSPALGDLDGDGIDEIIYRPSAFQVAAVDGTGVTVSGWSAKWVGSSGLAPVVSDVEGDGNVEVVVLGNDSLYVFSSTGAPIDGYPIPISGDRTSSQPCIGDIDGDGNKEVCFITTEGLKVRTLSSTTSVFSHSEVHNSGDLKLADTDHDARLELLVASDTDSNGESYLLVIGTNDSGIYCIEDTLFDEWGTGFLRPINPTFPFVGLDAFSLADLSNDGFAEVVSPVLPSQCAGAPKIVYFDGSGNVQDLLDSTALLSCLSTEEPGEVFPVGGDQDSTGQCVPIIGRVGSDICMLWTVSRGRHVLLHKIDGDPLVGPTGILLDYKTQPAAFRGASHSWDRSTDYATPSIFSCNSGTYIGITDFVPYKRASVRFYKDTSTNQPQEWGLARHDKYLTGCYRQPTLGTIDRDITWRDTVWLYGDVIVDTGATLTVRSGTVIRSHNDDLNRGGEDTTLAEIIVRGDFVVDGDSSRPVIFEAVSGESGDWYGIVVDSGGSLSVVHAEIKHAYKGVLNQGVAADSIRGTTIKGCALAGVWSSNSNMVLEDCIIRDIESGYGIYLDSCMPSFSNDSVVSCQYGIYARKCKDTLTGCTINGPGNKGIYVWDRIDTADTNALTLLNLSVSGEFTEHIYGYNANLVMDECSVMSNQDSTRSDYGVLLTFTWDFRLRDTEIEDHDAAGICTGFSTTFEDRWDLGVDTSGQFGYNSILSDDSSYRAIDASYTGPTFKAERNWWGSRDADSSLFAVYDTFHVDFQPCLTSDPYAKAAVAEDQPLVPDRFALHHNYPNPFNPTTTIQFDLPKASDVRLVIYNILGQRVVTLVDDHYPAGWHRVAWNGQTGSGDNASSGVYFYRIETDFNVDSKKMLLIK